MGRGPDLVERQRRPQRRVLLRHQPVAGGFAAAAASEGHVHLGGCGRLVSRHDAPWRHSLDVLGQLVRHAGQDRAIRAGGAGTPQRRRPALWCAATRPCRTKNSRVTDQVSATTFSSILSTTITTRRARPTGQSHRAVSIGGKLGRSGPAPARKFRRLRPRCFQGEMAGMPRPRAWTHFYTDYGRQLQKTILRFLSQG